MITYEEFVEKFEPIRNTFILVTPFENTMFENDNGDQMEFVESKPASRVWSYSPERGLINGLYFGSRYIGYFVCKKECLFKPGTFKINI